VESEEGFSVGDTIVITGGENSETRDIASFGSIVLDAPLDYHYPADSIITKVGGRYSSNAPSAEEHQEQKDPEASTAVVAGVAAALLACVVLGFLMRRRCLGRGRNRASEHGMRGADIEVGSGVPDGREKMEASVPERDAETADNESDALLPSMDFWLMPVCEFMRMPVDKPLPRHQDLRDMGLLVKRNMTVEDVLSGRFVADTAAVSHRWPIPDHFDPDCTKVANYGRF
jgi:hypothetical protein